MPAIGVKNPPAVRSRPSPDRSLWVLLEEVRETGAYVGKGTGDLVRVPGSGPAGEESELVRQYQDEPLYVTRISADPFIPISQARMLAANLDIEINF